MTKQFTPDLKLKAVNYYHKINNYVNPLTFSKFLQNSNILLYIKYLKPYMV